jgi:beta-lactamase class A
VSRSSTLDTGDRIEYHAATVLPAASVIKSPLLVELRRAARDNVSTPAEPARPMTLLDRPSG